MILEHNITGFMEWFIETLVSLGIMITGELENIKIWNNVSLLDFTITLAIISAFISIIIAVPQLGQVNRSLNQRDRKIREEKRQKSKGGKNK